MKTVPDAVAADADSLDRSFVRSVAWSGAGRWLTQLVSWPATIVIARMLSPEDYGLVVLVRVYTDFMSMLTEAGLGSAVTISGEMDDNRAGQLHTLSMMMGLTAVVISCIVAVPLRNVYHRPGLEWVVLALSSIFIIEAIGVVPNGLLRREFQYKALAIADWARSLTDLAVELTLAFLGFGYWTLVLGYLAGAVAWQAVVFSHRPLRYRRVHLNDVRATIKMMSHMVTQGLAGFVVVNSDLMIAGRLFSSGVVGAYSFGSQLAQLPTNKITSLIANVTPTLFRTVRHDLVLFRRYILLITQALSVLVLPAFIGMALVAPDFTAVVLGSKWSGIVIPLQLLALNAAVYSLFTVTPQVLWATDNGRIVTKYGLVSLALQPALFFILGRQFGVTGLAAAWLIGTPLVALPRARAALKIVELSSREYAKSLWPALSSVALMVAAVLAVQHVTRGPEWTQIVRLALSVATGGAAYAAAIFVLHRKHVRLAINTLRTIRR